MDVLQGGVITLMEKSIYQKIRSGMSRSRTLQELWWSSLMMQLRVAGVVPKGRKDEKENQLHICVDNNMEICQGPVVNMSQLSGLPPTVKWKVLEPQEEVV